MIVFRSVLVLILLLWFLPSRAYSSFVPSTFKLGFEQIQQSSLTNRERKSVGEMKFKSPNRLYFTVTSPDEVTFVTDGKLTYYYTAPFIEGESGELTIQESSDNILSQFFGSLAHGLTDNVNYKVELKGEMNAKIIFEADMARELGVDWAEFVFKSSTREFSNVEKLLLSQSDGTHLTLNFKELQTNVKLEDSVFNFTPPPNTKINR